MSEANLGSKSSLGWAHVNERLGILERRVGQIPSSFPMLAASRSAIETLTVSAHGFTVGQAVYRNGGGSLSKATWSNTQKVGLVVKVRSADVVDVCWWGELPTPSGVPSVAGTTYYLTATAGTLATSVAPTGTAKRAVYHAISSSRILVLGPAHHDWFTTTLEHCFDVTLTSPADGDVLTYDLASSKWKNTAGTTGLASLGARAALSVLGNATNAAAVAADIVAGTDGQVLHRNGTTLEFGKVGTTGLDNLAVTDAILAPASVLASKIGADVVLDTLNDVTITTVANLDFLRYDSASSQWINASLGEIQWAPSVRTLALDGGTTATAASKIGIGKGGSRMLLAGNTALEWVLSGDPDLGTEVSARVRSTGATDVSFYDQANSTFSAGDKVMEWGTNTTYATRYFRFLLPLQVRDNSGAGSKHLVVESTAAQTWTVRDDIGPSTWLKLLGTSADASGRRLVLGSDIDLAAGAWVIYADRTAGTLSSRLWIGTSDGVWAQDNDATITAPNAFQATGGNVLATSGVFRANTSGVSLYCSVSGTGQTGLITCTSSGVSLITSGSNPFAVTAASTTLSGDLTVAATRLTVTSTAGTFGVPLVVNSAVVSVTIKTSGTTSGVWDASKLVVGGSASGATTAALTTSSLSLAGNQIVGTRLGAIANVAAGGTVDTNCRTTVNAILSAMRTHGLIDP